MKVESKKENPTFVKGKSVINPFGDISFVTSDKISQVVKKNAIVVVDSTRSAYYLYKKSNDVTQAKQVMWLQQQQNKNLFSNLNTKLQTLESQLNDIKKDLSQFEENLNNYKLNTTNKPPLNLNYQTLINYQQTFKKLNNDLYTIADDIGFYISIFGDFSSSFSLKGFYKKIFEDSLLYYDQYNTLKTQYEIYFPSSTFEIVKKFVTAPFNTFRDNKYGPLISAAVGFVIPYVGIGSGALFLSNVSNFSKVISLINPSVFSTMIAGLYLLPGGISAFMGYKIDKYFRHNIPDLFLEASIKRKLYNPNIETISPKTITEYNQDKLAMKCHERANKISEKFVGISIEDLEEAKNLIEETLGHYGRKILFGPKDIPKKIQYNLTYKINLALAYPIEQKTISLPFFQQQQQFYQHLQTLSSQQKKIKPNSNVQMDDGLQQRLQLQIEKLQEFSIYIKRFQLLPRKQTERLQKLQELFLNQMQQLENSKTLSAKQFERLKDLLKKLKIRNRTKLWECKELFSNQQKALNYPELRFVYEAIQFYLQIYKEEKVKIDVQKQRAKDYIQKRI